MDKEFSALHTTDQTVAESYCAEKVKEHPGAHVVKGANGEFDVMVSHNADPVAYKPKPAPAEGEV